MGLQESEHPKPCSSIAPGEYVYIYIYIIHIYIYIEIDITHTYIYNIYIYSLYIYIHIPLYIPYIFLPHMHTPAGQVVMAWKSRALIRGATNRPPAAAAMCSGW